MPMCRCRGGAKDGQSLVESCIIICLIAFIFAGLFQVSQMFAAREILYHAAARGARAKTVGLNWWMVEKAIRVAAIPNAGRMTEPAFQDSDTALETWLIDKKPGALWETVLNAVPSSLQWATEQSKIPEYMGVDNKLQGEYVLDYQDWDSIRGDHDSGSIDESPLNPIVRVQVTQQYPLRVPAHRAFYAADSVRIKGESQIENHYPVYIDDKFW